MKSGYKILWTQHALNELAATYTYLETNFTERELKKLSKEIDRTLKLISHNPYLFPMSKGVRRVVIKKMNSLYYKVTNNEVQILSFFLNRQHPNKKKT